MILFFNPRSAPRKPSIPLSILALMRMFPPNMINLVDGNLLADPLPTLRKITDSVPGIKHIALTVMPGPQVPVAIHVSRTLRPEYPELDIIWGGYFPSFHYHVILHGILWVFDQMEMYFLVVLTDQNRSVIFY